MRAVFSPEICSRIAWAIIDDGRAFFNSTTITPQDFSVPGRVVFPMSFLTNILENVSFCNPIQRGNFPQEWMAGYRLEKQGQQKGRQGTESPGTRGGKGGGGTLGAGGVDTRDRAMDVTITAAGAASLRGNTRALEGPPTGGADIKGGIRAGVEVSDGHPRPQTPVTP